MKVGKLWACLLLGQALIVSCGDDTPTTPRTEPSPARVQAPFPSGTVLQIVSGDTDAPVVGAEVTVGSSHMTTDAAGRVALPADFSNAAFVDIAQGDFLIRQTRLLTVTGTRFTLIPKSSSTGLTEDFVRDVLFHDAVSGGSRYMMRIRPGTATAWVAPSSQILRDVRAMAIVHAAIDDLNEILGGEIRFEVDEAPPEGSIAFDLVIDPNDPALADGIIGVAYRRYSGWNIIGGRIVFDSMETVRTSTTHHELGHMVGLGHSDALSDVMYPYLSRRIKTYSPRERLGIRLLMQRPAANRHPDNDREVSDPRSLSPASESVVVCPGWSP